MGLAVTVLTGLCFYRADLELILLQCGKGIWNALPILLIIATAILLYQVGEEAGAFPVIRNGMRKFLPNELLLVLAMGWILESFLQGITGFGVPVAVGGSASDGDRSPPCVGGDHTAAGSVLGEYLWDPCRELGYAGSERGHGGRKRSVS